MNFDFSDIKVLVIGDFMIDHYIIGESNRMSPEAPVPVVVPKEEYSIPGGAGNVAMNLKLMGADISCIGCVGKDIWGEKLLSILKNEGINTKRIEIIDDHTTTLKQRIYSDGKQVARLDIEKIINWKIDENTKVDTSDIAENYDVLILSDYNKGVLHNSDLFLTLISVSQLSPNNRLKTIIVDPKKDDFHHYNGVNIITPNLNELHKATKMKIDDNESIIKACKKLIEEYGIEYVVAKKGDE
ncbi:MAG: PfkB family carbohydrate kinase, partial [Gammaproteobacteria bacterium]